MFFQLMSLHWGQITKEVSLEVFNVDPIARVISPIRSGDAGQQIMAEGIVQTTSGSGRAKRIKASGRVMRLSGKGKVC